MLSNVNIFGELVSATIVTSANLVGQKLDTKFVVEKYIDGVFKSSYPKTSYGQAKAFAYNLVKK